MHVCILTFEGFNELDSLVALGILQRVSQPGWRVSLACPTPQVTSMNGVQLSRQASLEEASQADAVIIGSGLKTRDVLADAALMEQLRLDPHRQLLAAQCSGALILAQLGCLHSGQACTDLTTRPWLEAMGIKALDQPFWASGNVATAGGCLASPYLAAWLITRLVDEEAAAAALHYVAPVGEKRRYVQHALEVIQRS